MTRAVAAIVALALIGCASGGGHSAAPAPVPADARLAELQTSMTELLERLDVLSDRIARLEAEREAVPAPPRQTAAAPQQPAAQAPPAAVKSADIADVYRTAIVHYGGGRVAQARASFQQVFDADPSGDLADNALFWIAETYYASGDYANAISHYQRVAAEYGDQNKAPDALYKLALAYSKTGDLALARQTLQEVIRRYPYSAAAASSRAELERIKY